MEHFLFIGKVLPKQQYVWSRLHVFSQLYRIIPAPINFNNFIQILINFRFWENVCTLQKFLLFFWQENLMHSSVESSPSKGDASSLAPSLLANKLLDAFLVYKRQKVGNGGIWAVLQFWIKHVIHGFRCFSKVSLSLELLSIHPCFWDSSLLNTIWSDTRYIVPPFSRPIAIFGVLFGQFWGQFLPHLLMFFKR